MSSIWDHTMQHNNHQALTKKIDLRSKATRTASLAAKIASHKRELAAQPEYHENTLLKLLKTTKKQKQEIKTKAFNERLLSQTLKLKGSVAKSERKRRAKERKEQLKPKIKDLLTSLPQKTINLVTTAPRSRDNYIETSKPEGPDFNPFKITGRLKLIHMERARFTQVLNNEQFRKSPFAALKLAIGQNLDSSA